MISLNITMVGIEKAMLDMENLAVSKLPSVVKEGLKKSADYVLMVLQQNVPVDTGKLRENLFIDSSFLELNQISIGPNTTMLPHYAPDIEFGHHTRNGGWVPGRWFIGRTRIQTAPQIGNIFSSVLSDKLNG